MERPGPWQFFTHDEAAAIEAIVDRLIPRDELSAGGKDAGCADFIDRQLRGPFGDSRQLYMRAPFAKGMPEQGPQSSLVPAQRYRAGLAALDACCKQNFSGKNFVSLVPAEQVAANQLPFPFRNRALMLGWNLLNFDRTPFRADPNASVERNRGAYLVDGLGHCGSCHTAKNILGGDKRDGYLQGAVLQGWFVPSISGDPRVGIGEWPRDEIVDYLRAGANHWTVVSGPMAEEVRNSSTYLTVADLRAIAIYLKGVPPAAAASPRPLPSNDARMESGRAIYQDVCSACHTEPGLGANHLFPRLARSPAVQSDNATTLIRVVIAGSSSGGTALAPTAPGMPAMAGRLTESRLRPC